MLHPEVSGVFSDTGTVTHFPRSDLKALNADAFSSSQPKESGPPTTHR
jgi:hypothetical protein